LALFIASTCRPGVLVTGLAAAFFLLRTNAAPGSGKGDHSLSALENFLHPEQWHEQSNNRDD